MRKIIISLLMTLVCACGFAQVQDVRVDDMLYKHLSRQQVETLRANNPRQLVIENYNMVSFCYLAMKMTEEEGTYQMKGELKDVVRKGKTCDYALILRDGCINRYDFNLEQDPYKQNVYTLGDTGAYIVVLSKQKFDNNLNAALREYGFAVKK